LQQKKATVAPTTTLLLKRACTMVPDVLRFDRAPKQVPLPEFTLGKRPFVETIDLTTTPEKLPVNKSNHNQASN
jgi:hypothetical protein